MAAPDDRWGNHGQLFAALGVDEWNPTFCLRMRIGEDGQELIRRGSIITVPENGLWLGANDGDPRAWYTDNAGNIRVKRLLVTGN